MTESTAAEVPMQALVDALRSDFRGQVLVPGDAGFDEARTLWNAVHDPRPAVIARCRGDADVIRAVNQARETGVAVAVRGGGHNVAGTASVDGGLVIDLSEMTAVQVDPGSRQVTAQAGATIADLDRETQAHGLAVPMGVVSATGIAGLTLGGGMGWLRRKYGLSCDALTAATVVTSDGRFRRASGSENADLLWALRGGGGRLGVVTSFEYQAYEVGPDVAFAATFFPLEEARRVFRAHDAFLREDPGEVSTLLALGRLPHEQPVPEAVRGRPFAAILAMYAGDARQGWPYLRPLREIAEPLLDLGGIMPYVDAQRFFDDDYPDGLRYYWKSTSLVGMDDDVVDVLVKHARRAPSDRSTLDVWYHGGAVERRGAEASAYGRRDLRYLVNAEANWERPEDDEANISWARDCLADLEPFAHEHVYLNFPGFYEEGEALTRAAFGDAYEGLRELSAAYDPHGMFRGR